MKNKLVGTWELVSHCRVDEQGGMSYPLGRRPSGYLIYSPEGFMSVCITSQNRRLPRGFDFHDIPKLTPAQKTRLLHSCISYAGKYRVLKDKVIHQVQVSLIPSWVGKKLIRKIDWPQGKLSLTSPPFVINNTKYRARILWQRVLR